MIRRKRVHWVELHSADVEVAVDDPDEEGDSNDRAIGSARSLPPSDTFREYAEHQCYVEDLNEDGTITLSSE